MFVFPLAPFTATVAAFQKEFPATLLRFDIESSAVMERVLERRCAVGVMASLKVEAASRVNGNASISSDDIDIVRRSFESPFAPEA